MGKACCLNSRACASPCHPPDPPDLEGGEQRPAVPCKLFCLQLELRKKSVGPLCAPLQIGWIGEGGWARPAAAKALHHQEALSPSSNHV